MAKLGEQSIDASYCIMEFEESPLKENDKLIEAQDPFIEVDIEDSQNH